MGKTIDFTDNMTTRQAFVCSIRYTAAFFRCAYRDINVFAHRLPWVCVGMTALAAMAVGFVVIGSARAERDRASKKQAALQQQVEQLSVALEARKED